MAIKVAGDLLPNNKPLHSVVDDLTGGVDLRKKKLERPLLAHNPPCTDCGKPGHVSKGSKDKLETWECINGHEFTFDLGAWEKKQP